MCVVIKCPHLVDKCMHINICIVFICVTSLYYIVYNVCLTLQALFNDNLTSAFVCISLQCCLMFIFFHICIALNFHLLLYLSAVRTGVRSLVKASSDLTLLQVLPALPFIFLQRTVFWQKTSDSSIHRWNFAFDPWAWIKKLNLVANNFSGSVSL